MKINDVIHAKSKQAVVTISPDATVRELVALLAEHNVGALVVSEDGEQVSGHRRASATSYAACTTTRPCSTPAVSQIMTSDGAHLRGRRRR